MADKHPAAIILSGGPKSVHVDGAPRLDPDDLRARRPDLRHLLRRPADRPAARRHGRPRHARRVRPCPPHAHRRVVGAARRHPRRARRVDEPLRRHHRAAGRLRGDGEHARRAGRRARARRAPDLGRAVPSRGRPLAARHGGAAHVPARPRRLRADVEDGVGRRRAGRRASAIRSAASACCARCRAASTRRWRRRSSSAPSATSSRASTSTPD